MRHFALSAIGRDKPGIVAGVTGVLVEHGANIEDSQMSILRGHFAMTLILAAPGGTDEAQLRYELQHLASDLGLEAISLDLVAETAEAERAEPSHIVTVYGADHPGIVHAATSALAAHGVNITDLNTRLADRLYVLVMEVAPPEGLGEDELRALLEPVAGEQGVEVSVRPLEADVL
jgi:glycine cleavage system transcriptional repressor